MNAHKRLATPQGANQAVAAAKLGYPTYFMGQIGRDSNAAMLRTSLESCSVNLSHLRELDGPSGTALILLQVALVSAAGCTFIIPCQTGLSAAPAFGTTAY